MKVDKENLEKVAHLARLNIKPDEEEKLMSDMSDILSWVEKLKELDTDDVQPLTHMTDEVNVLRMDKAKKTITTSEGLKNAPDGTDEYFKVPKVLKRNS